VWAVSVSPGTVTAVTTPVLGIVGGGHLRRRLVEAATRLGVQTRVFDTPDMVESGRGAGVDVLTVVTDDIDPAVMLDWERSGLLVRPGPSTMAIVTDRVAMRRLVSATGVPVTPWRQVTNETELRAALTTWPTTVIKTARAGRYRTGVEMPATPLEGLRSGMASLRDHAQLLVEPFLDLTMELSVAVVRRPTGDTDVYAPVRTVQLFGRCREVVAPAGIDPETAERVAEIARTLAERLQVVGLLVVEVFVTGGEVMVNEVVARPHHAAAHADVAFQTSQFENHVRGVLDFPLGSCAPIDTIAVSVNVVGNAAGNDPRHHVADALAVDPTAKVELRGEPHRFDRILGQVTVTGAEESDARRRAWQTVIALRGDLTPIRPVVGGGRS